jgi:hypothetical protein
MGLVPEHEFKGFRYRILMPDYDRQQELCVGQLKQYPLKPQPLGELHEYSF